MKPLVLCILDGVGIRKEIYGNAFKQAVKPNFDYLWNNYPHSLLEASGPMVGLPEGQMGTSEVGHMNIGAGRLVYQPLQLINEKIQDKTFFQNENILEVINHTKKNNSKLHILGLLSDGGIHSHINHLFSIIDMCKDNGINEIYFHMFLDGRDTLANVALKYLEQLNEKIKMVGLGSIATISGRYYAMDRDNNYDRIKKSYDAITLGEGNKYNNYQDLIKESYNQKITDEFIIPSVLDSDGLIEKNDGLILFNFRPDRLRELFSALTNPSFTGFERQFIDNLKLVSMMPISDEVIGKTAFELENLDNILGVYLEKNNIKQLRIAETEKYAHVTYFFDSEKHLKIKNCNQILIPSPKVATYDLKPEMSAYLITDKLIEIMHDYDVIILNYANGDMVGHTGSFDATVKAVEVIDECLGKVFRKVEELKGTLIVTADHGNCDYMIDENGNAVTSHSTSLVPFIINKTGFSLENGKLGDIAPTILSLLKLEIPKEMTGKNLIKR